MVQADSIYLSFKKNKSCITKDIEKVSSVYKRKTKMRNFFYVEIISPR